MQVFPNSFALASCSHFHYFRVHEWFMTYFVLQKRMPLQLYLLTRFDVIATTRFDAQTGGSLMNGFDQTVNVKVIMATNQANTLDPALLHPGRLDHKIEFPCLINAKKVCTAKMNLSDEVDLEDYVFRP